MPFFIFLGGLLLAAASWGASSTKESYSLETRWVFPHGSQGFELSPQERTRPIIVGDIVYIGRRDGTVAAVHRTEGYRLWQIKIPSNGAIDGAFSYGRSKLFVGDTKGNLFALATRDGSVVWTFKAQTQFLSPPLVARDRVFVAASNDEVFALGESDGKEKWQYGRKGDEKMTIRGTGSPTAYGSDVFHGFADGYLVALSGAKGEVLWSKKLRSRDRFYDVDMAPYVDESVVIAATYDGSVYCMSRTNGDLKWAFKVGSYAGFLVEGDKVYFSGLDGHVYALDKNTGAQIWKTPYEKGVGMTPTRVGDSIAVTTSSDPMYLLDPASGEVRTSVSLGQGTLAPAIGNPEGWLYVLSNFGNVFSYEVFKGKPARLGGPETIPVPSAVLRIAAKN